MDTASINTLFLVGASLVAVSALTSLISQRIGAPLLLVFLAIGLLAGEDGLLGIEFDSGATAYSIGALALAIILFDSGFHTPLRSFRMAAAPALTLATLGVVPGAVTPFALLNAPPGAVAVYFDRRLLEEDPLNFHPLDNSMTTTVARDGLLAFLAALGHAYETVDLEALA